MSQNELDQRARENAISQWTNNPCGAVENTHEPNLSYFLEVEKNRYLLQKWMKPYFKFENFDNKKVLEIGVGHGTDLIQFAKAGAQCYGVDITDKHLNLTAKNFALRSLPVELKKCDATQISYPDSSFDVIYSFGVIHHIPEAELVLAEVSRLLKPGGRFYFSVYNKYSSFHLLWVLYQIAQGKLFKLGYRGILSTIEKGADGIQIKPYVELYTPKKIKKMLHGFTILKMDSYQLAPEILNGLPFARFWEKHFGWFLTCTAIKN